jgi:DNA-binding NtrC family response regulator
VANAINVALSHARAGAALVGSAREPAAAFAASLAGGGAPRGFSSRRLREADATRAAALVIGGDATQRRFCATFLETLGLSITVAEDFCDGVRALASEAPRLVILDARATGFEPAAWSRIVDACEVRPKVFVVVDPADDRVNGAMAELAFDGFLPRPIRSLDLVRAAELAAR